MECWLRCRVYPGQFSVEYAVVVRQFDGAEVSLFVPLGFVNCPLQPSFDRPVAGWMVVQLVSKNEKLPSCAYRVQLWRTANTSLFPPISWKIGTSHNLSDHHDPL